MWRIVVLSLLLALVYCPAAAETLPEPLFPTTPAQRDRVVVEDVYYFTRRDYVPPVPVEFVTRAEASHANPEKATIAYISAMAAQDFAWARSTWTEAAQRLLAEHDTRMQQTPEFWTNLWAKTFKDKRVELHSRIETGGYVFIGYKIVPATPPAAPASDSAAGVIELVAVLTQDHGQWRATQELAYDPVLHYWKAPETKVQRIMRQ